IATQPSHGTVTLNANGSFRYEPAADFNGPDSFTYIANDGLEDSNPATVTVNVGAVGDDPLLLPDSYQLREDQTLTVAAPGVLANDSDPDGDPLTATLVTSTARGVVTLAADGSFTYKPEADHFGSDSFTYRVTDGTSTSSPVLVSLNVLPVNDPPTFAKGPDQIVQQNAGPVILENWATDIRPGPANESAQTVQFTLSTDNDALFSVRPAMLPNGTLLFTPAQGRYGLAMVTILARDNGGTANGGSDSSTPVTFRILVNAPPVVAITSPEDGNIYFPHQVIPYAAAASDPDGTVTNVTLRINGNAIASFDGAPYSTGVSNLPPAAYQLTATARDDLGAGATSPPVGLTVIPRPPVMALGQAFNFQVDLVEQRVRVDNPTPYPITAVRVLVTDLQPGVRLFNASGTNSAGVPYVQFNREVPARSSVQLTIEYLTPLVQTVRSTLTGEIAPIAPPPPTAPPGSVLINLKRLSSFPDGRMLLTFDSIKGRIYFIEYSEDLENWKTAFPSVTAVGDGIQWTDNGWPKTEGHPNTVDKRFYRVKLAPLPPKP
ncbi:MAG TPA: hypothetical protein DCY13_21515, partial [Verrucomicrobiales bacterium]|nr:hypothetical protein [Verrucomicrobiales bacterium]